MQITIKATNIELTAPLKEYIEAKIWSLNKFVEKWDLEGALIARVEVGRTTEHHHKGDVFRAEVNLSAPGRLLRAEAKNFDIRVAIDEVREKLQLEIKKYIKLHQSQNSRAREVNRKLRGK